MWALTNIRTRWLHARVDEPIRWSAARRAALLDSACTALRFGYFEEARTILAGDRDAAEDAACLNLLGVIHECLHEWKLARKFYGRAIAADRAFGAAQQNMRRMYELQTFGRSRQPVSLGDEPTCLAMLISARQHLPK